MEVLITNDLKVCIKCNQPRNKKFCFNKRSKTCKTCVNNLNNNKLEFKVNCLYCLWRGTNNKYLEHECITNLNRDKIIFKKVKDIEKENPFLITFD